MTGTQPRHGIIPWPPVIYVMAIALSVVLGMFCPLPWIGDIFGDCSFDRATGNGTTSKSPAVGGCFVSSRAIG